MLSGVSWVVVVFVGAFVLLGAIMWATFNNRTSRAKLEMTERATAERFAENDTTDRTRN